MKMPPKNKDYTSGFSATAIKQVAATIYAAAAGEDDKMMQYVGSTLFNRLESGKPEFGAQNGNISEVIYHPGAYYEKNSQLFEDFKNGNFKDEKSKAAAMRAASIASALTRGTIERMPGEFWFNDEEIAKLSRNKKVFDFSKVQELGKMGKKGQFKMYGYPTNPNGGKVVKTFDPSQAMEDLGFSDVKQMQSHLALNGEYTGAIDGKYGPNTHKAYLNLKKRIAG